MPEGHHGENEIEELQKIAYLVFSGLLVEDIIIQVSYIMSDLYVGLRADHRSNPKVLVQIVAHAPSCLASQNPHVASRQI